MLFTWSKNTRHWKLPFIFTFLSSLVIDNMPHKQYKDIQLEITQNIPLKNTHFFSSSPPSGPWTTSSASTYFPKRSKIMKYSWTWNSPWKMRHELYMAEINRNRLPITRPTSASASIFSSLTIFSTIRSANGRNMVWESFSSCAEMAWNTYDMADVGEMYWWTLERQFYTFILICIDSSMICIAYASKKIVIPASPSSWPTRSNTGFWGRFYTAPFQPVRSADTEKSFNINNHFVGSRISMKPYLNRNLIFRNVIIKLQWLWFN